MVLRVEISVEINQECLIELIIPLYYANIYYSQTSSIHKKNNGNVSLIVYRIERSWTKGHATLIFA